MIIYQYNTFNELGEDILETLSDEDIINSYYDFWISKMRKKFTEEELATFDLRATCIRDWVIVHWAWEVNARS